MNRHSLLVPLALVSLVAFVRVGAADQPAVAKATKHSLWKATKGPGTVYLLGSVHVQKKEAYPLPEVIEKAYADTKRVVFEVDLKEAENPEFQGKTLALGLYTDGQTLEGSVSPETLEALKKAVEGSPLGAAQLNAFRPWLCAMTVVVLKLQKLGFDPNFGIDKYFFGKATEDKKEIVGLETALSQVELMSSLDKGNEEKFLLQTLKELNELNGAIDKMIKAWKDGDTATLEQLLLKSFKEYPELYERFLVKRNKAWAPRIEELAKKDGTTLVVVGAGHLVGKDSVLDLLKAQGFTVEQL